MHQSKREENDMRILRGLAGSLLWILAALVGLLGVVSCVTIILLPLGIPLLMLARRLFSRAVKLMLPPAMAHPAKTARGSLRERTKDGLAGLRKAGREGQKARTRGVKTTKKKAKRLRKRLT
jgi:hypothetical protein